ncbi:MAG: FimV/HubP family polar landmark protein [Gammaproteobacteria bacterium]
MDKRLKLQVADYIDTGWTYDNSPELRAIIDSVPDGKDFYESLLKSQAKLKAFFSSKELTKSRKNLDAFVDKALKEEKKRSLLLPLNAFLVTSCALLFGLNLFMQPVEIAEKEPFFELPEITFQPIVTVSEPSTSLWRLADSLSRELDVSIYQAMFGIYLYNADAFINMDMNMMRADKSLAIPDKSYMKLLSPKISEDIVKTFTS